MDGRTLREIQEELDDATERRAALWRRLAEDGDSEKSAEVARLSERIQVLWSEARVARTRARFGDPALIHARARADERLEREYAKVA